VCGIAGIVYSDPSIAVDPAVLRRMDHAIRHRGPDDSGVWTGPGIGLVHRRLSIIDLSAAGHQPMSNEDGSVWIVFNGEIYNFQELRKDLVARGHAFRSATDSEVIVHLYEEEGEACVEQLDGMFAFAIWDVRRRRLLLARDRVGKKPLKYAEIPGGIAFASELKALLAADLVDRAVAVDEIHDYLTFGCIPAPGTGFARIRKLEPGHRLVWERGKIFNERYWSLDYRAKRRLSASEWRDEVRRSVRSAVERRMVADVPLGAFLSGGIDSSIVVACMAQASTRPVETFSIGFEHEAYNELPYARQVAERWKTSHHEFVVRADDGTLLPALAQIYEEPFADSSALPSWFLARETRRHVTVALNGDGGDEGFAGYARYGQFLAWRRRARALGPLRRIPATIAAVPGLPPQLRRNLAVAASLLEPDLGTAWTALVRLFTESEKRELYRGGLFPARPAPSSRVSSRWLEDPRAGENTLDRICFSDVMAYLPDVLLVKMDLATMAHSLEARSPLLDHHVLELAASAPAEVRLPDGRLKGLLKDAFRDELPAGLIERPKMGFGVPIDAWFRGVWAPIARDLLLSSDARVGAYFQREVLERYLEEHVAGRIHRAYQIFALVMLELWHREVVELRAPAADRA
jgi:asparagine synthase (glutamine-hydrolysing)